MSQNPNGGAGYNPYGQNPTNPSNPGYPGSPGNPGYPGTPSNPGYPNTPSNPGYPNTPSYPGIPGTVYGTNPPSGPNPNYPSQNPSTPNSGYGQYDNPYVTPPPPPSPTVNPYDPYAQTVQSQNTPSYPNYAPLNPPTTMPPSQPRRNNTMTIAIVAIVLVLVIGGVIAALVAHTNSQNATSHANATSTAVQGTAYTQQTVTAQGTISAQQTAQANTYPFSSNVILNDPLTTGSADAGWDNDGKNCFFKGSAYHIADSDANTYQPCFANKTDFSDFTLEVSMQISKGDSDASGGLIFRGDGKNNKFYRVYVDSDGNYGILVAVDTTGTNTRVLDSGVADNFKTGTDVTNIISIVARGDQISLYINKEKTTTVTDSTYTHGQIGLTAGVLDGSPAEVVYSNLKIYKL